MEDKDKEFKIYRVSDGKVHYTDDYDMFHRLKGNRGIKADRKAKIRASIMKCGYIPVPIVANEDYAIIDGQGRWQVLKELGISMAYVVVAGLGIADCIEMNIVSTPWKDIDYIESFADQGNENYIRLVNLMDNEVAKWAKPTNIIMASTGKSSAKDVIRNEELVLTDEIEDYAVELLSYVDMMADSITGQLGCVPTKLANAIMFAYQVEGTDRERLKATIEQNAAGFGTSATTPEYLISLSAAYNHKIRGGVKARKYFDKDYEAMNDPRSWYARKWHWGKTDEEMPPEQKAMKWGRQTSLEI